MLSYLPPSAPTHAGTRAPPARVEEQAVQGEGLLAAGAWRVSASAWRVRQQTLLGDLQRHLGGRVDGPGAQVGQHLPVAHCAL